MGIGTRKTLPAKNSPGGSPEQMRLFLSKEEGAYLYGEHGVVLYGEPGIGKTLLAKILYLQDL